MAHSVDKEQLSALLDDELNDAERDAVLAHLDECADCRAYFAELAALHDAMGELDRLEPPAGFAESVLKRLHGGNRSKRRSWRGWTALAACAAVAVLVLNVIPRAPQSADSTAEPPRMNMTAATSAAAEPEETPEAMLETQMLFMSGGGSGASTEAEEAMDALAAMPEAAYGGVVEENTVAPDETGAAVERTLIGIGVHSWLAEHGWQGESGDWYADAADLRALPEGLTLDEPLPEDFTGAARIRARELSAEDSELPLVPATGVTAP